MDDAHEMIHDLSSLHDDHSTYSTLSSTIDVSTQNVLPMAFPIHGHSHILQDYANHENDEYPRNQDCTNYDDGHPRTNEGTERVKSCHGHHNIAVCSVP